MAKLRLEIVTPEAKAFSEEVDMVVLPGVEGELGVLPLHVPLMTRLLPGEVRITQGQKQLELVVGNGFVEILPDRVAILTDMAMTDSDVDEQTAEDAVARAQTALRDKSLNTDEMAEVESALARSIAQLRFKRRKSSH
jgi:F-type H+-transporting ATPase subunit epsilon